MSSDEPVRLSPDDEATELSNLIGDYVKDPGRLLECYYWSEEPGIAECVRAIIGMPPEARIAFFAFFASAVVRSSITATVNKDGSLTLYAPEAAMILKSLFSTPQPQTPTAYPC